MASNKRKSEDTKTYIIQYTFELNGVTRTPGEPIRICTVWKGTNSKNPHYLPADLVELLIERGAIKSYALCD